MPMPADPPLDPRRPAEPIAARRSALIVIDMQVGFLEPGEPAVVPGARDIIAAINAASRAMRAAGGLVVFTRHTIVDSRPGALPPRERALIPDAVAARFAPGAPPHALHPAIDVAPDDLVVDKYRYSALATQSSPLDAMLRQRGIDTIAIAGTVTNVCCESTARDGYSLDYRLLFLSDATAAASAEAQALTLATLGQYFACVLDVDALAGLLDGQLSPNRR
jgi:ureidoacrylate peracid hydrolase